LRRDLMDWSCRLLGGDMLLGPMGEGDIVTIFGSFMDVSMTNGREVRRKCILSLLFREAFNLLADHYCELGKFFQCDILSWVQWAKDLIHRLDNLFHDVLATSMQQPPAEGQVFSIRLEVIAVGVFDVIIIMVL
jgi:hypothetical protein